MPTMLFFRRSFQSVAAIFGIFLAALAGAHLNNPELLVSDSFARAFTSQNDNRTAADGRHEYRNEWAQVSDQQYSWPIETAALRSPPAIHTQIQTALNDGANLVDTHPLLHVGNKIVLAPTSETRRRSPVIMEITGVAAVRDDVTRLDASLSAKQWVMITARLDEGDDSQIVQFILELPATYEHTNPSADLLLEEMPAQVL